MSAPSLRSVPGPYSATGLSGDLGVMFVGADELRDSTPVEPDWALAGYIAAGAVTVLAKKPKAGGSTLLLGMLAAIASGADTFLGQPVSGGPVVYVSEESASTLAHKLPGTGRIRVMTRDAAWPRPTWPALIAAAAAEAHRVGASVLAIDTLAYWAALGKDAENDAGAINLAMQPVLDAARDGVAVVLAVHSRKSGGDDGDSIRGSGAIAGAADIILELQRGKAPTERILKALSRYPSTPSELVFDYEQATGTWRVASGGRPGRNVATPIRDDALMEQVSEIIGAGSGSSKRAVRDAVRAAGVQAGNVDIDHALGVLSDEGFIAADTRSRAHSYTLLQPYRADRARTCQDRAGHDAEGHRATVPLSPKERARGTGHDHEGTTDPQDRAGWANAEPAGRNNTPNWTDAQLQALIDSDPFNAQQDGAA